MERIPLAAADRPKAVYRYYVSGTGVFPVDMLRYDSCWPHDSQSLQHFDFGRVAPLGERRTVQLRSYQPPTIDRWRSFGWLVE